MFHPIKPGEIQHEREQKKAAEKELTDAQPFFGGADPTRLAAAIEGARAAGVADAVVAPAEAKLLAPRYAAVRNHPKSKWGGMGAGASDLLRADLLSRYGGVWVDTSVCPFQALDDWLPAALEARDGLFIPRAFDDEAIEGALADLPAAAMRGSELEQFEGCLYEHGLRLSLIHISEPTRPY